MRVLNQPAIRFHGQLTATKKKWLKILAVPLGLSMALAIPSLSPAKADQFFSQSSTQKASTDSTVPNAAKPTLAEDVIRTDKPVWTEPDVGDKYFVGIPLKNIINVHDLKGLHLKRRGKEFKITNAAVFCGVQEDGSTIVTLALTVDRPLRKGTIFSVDNDAISFEGKPVASSSFKIKNIERPKDS